MPTLKAILGYNSKELAFDTFGTSYLKSTTNPGAMLALDAILVVRDDNTSFTEQEILWIRGKIVEIQNRNLKLNTDGAES